MSKSYSPDIIKYVDNIRDYWKGVVGGKNKIFLNHLVSNTTNTSKDIVIIPTEDIHKNITWSLKNSDIAKSVRILKKNPE